MKNIVLWTLNSNLPNNYPRFSISNWSELKRYYMFKPIFWIDYHSWTNTHLQQYWHNMRLHHFILFLAIITWWEDSFNCPGQITRPSFCLHKILLPMFQIVLKFTQMFKSTIYELTLSTPSKIVFWGVKAY
jgi:hypothetical protein